MTDTPTKSQNPIIKKPKRTGSILLLFFICVYLFKCIWIWSVTHNEMKCSSFFEFTPFYIVITKALVIESLPGQIADSPVTIQDLCCNRHPFGKVLCCLRCTKNSFGLDLRLPDRRLGDPFHNIFLV